MVQLFQYLQAIDKDFIAWLSIVIVAYTAVAVAPVSCLTLGYGTVWLFSQYLFANF